jgi:hypothetical protein
MVQQLAIIIKVNHYLVAFDCMRQNIKSIDTDEKITQKLKKNTFTLIKIETLLNVNYVL